MHTYTHKYEGVPRAWTSQREKIVLEKLTYDKMKGIRHMYDLYINPEYHLRNSSVQQRPIHTFHQVLPILCHVDQVNIPHTFKSWRSEEPSDLSVSLCELRLVEWGAIQKDTNLTDVDGTREKSENHLTICRIFQLNTLQIRVES